MPVPLTPANRACYSGEGFSVKETRMQIIDADGHVNDRPCMDEISKYMPPGNRTQVFLLSTTFIFITSRAAASVPAPAMSARRSGSTFFDETEIEWTAVYATAGLAVGRIIAEDCAIAACRAYNNWLHEKFTRVTPRIKGVALIPIQDTEAAAAELRRALKELGMVAAMLPSTS
jgi:hypothetical protein